MYTQCVGVLNKLKTLGSNINPETCACVFVPVQDSPKCRFSFITDIDLWDQVPEQVRGANLDFHFLNF